VDDLESEEGNEKLLRTLGSLEKFANGKKTRTFVASFLFNVKTVKAAMLLSEHEFSFRT